MNDDESAGSNLDECRIIDTAERHHLIAEKCGTESIGSRRASLAVDVDDNAKDTMWDTYISEEHIKIKDSGSDDYVKYLKKRVAELERSLEKEQTFAKDLRKELDEERKCTAAYNLASTKAMNTEKILTDDCQVKNEPNEVLVQTSRPERIDRKGTLSPDEVMRYSRQLLLTDGFGVEGQIKLLSSSILVIGAGGIGSSLLQYLAASGIGRISIVDFDQVDTSNLHRQVIHKSCNTGKNKALSATQALHDLNPTIQVLPIQKCLTHDNALKLVSTHDCIIDASDNPQTRYIVNDACVLAKKPLISGSAMGTEGQLTVYNSNMTGNDPYGCYRCLYPKMNSSDGCKSCSDNGVLGTVPGLIGILQATEAIKLLTGIGSTLHDRLLMYDSLRCSFISIKKPPRNKTCLVCGEKPLIKTLEDSECLTREKMLGPNIDSSMQQKRVKLEKSFPSALNVSCKDFESMRKSGASLILLDVRVERQYELCHLQESINIPLHELRKQVKRIESLSEGEKPVYVICRRGIASAEATRMLLEVIESYDDPDSARKSSRIHSVFNISGGYASYQVEVDPSFPRY